MKKIATINILTFIKTRGEVTAALLAEELGMTKEGARLNLLKLAEDGVVQSSMKSERVGRPITYYTLTDKGRAYLPDAHAQVTVDLLDSVKKLLGDNALDLLIGDREQQTYQRYEKALTEADTLEQRLDTLARIRTQEGYMAEWTKEDDAYFLIENHCPICAAAKACQGFCRAELTNFRALIGKEFKVDRIKHIVADDQRCVYRITR
ncbi:helix-turn-helix transcriptional regulator [Chitinophaga sedimenti]|uniref:helix-turn-helix transcriptional regulator n=1 Tax=Chitinophaga sedimenti TaxID=2033606 RepID=UPI002004D365|nr:helix-turn-helix transcriptional regulator [Chitinophaga sedimenti]MCK7554123.1 helix-turn-helix transcriptional regulator [Chitinophaga sedimenti]